MSSSIVLISRYLLKHCRDDEIRSLSSAIYGGLHWFCTDETVEYLRRRPFLRNEYTRFQNDDDDDRHHDGGGGGIYFGKDTLTLVLTQPYDVNTILVFMDKYLLTVT